MTPQRRGGAAFLARCPGAVAETLGVHVLHGHACDGGPFVVCKDRRDGGVHDEGNEEEESKHREYRGRTEAQGRIELGLFQERLYLQRLLFLLLRPHDDRGLVRINGEAVCNTTLHESTTVTQFER